MWQVTFHGQNHAGLAYFSRLDLVEDLLSDVVARNANASSEYI